MPQHPLEWLRETARLEQARNRYVDSLAGIREVAEFAGEHLAEFDERRGYSVHIRYLPNYRDQSGRPLPNFKGFSNSIGAINTSLGDDDTIELRDLLIRALAHYKSSFPDGVDTNILDDFIVIREPPAKVDLLLTSLLVTAVSDFEVLFAYVARYFFNLRSQALKAQSPKVGWAEIESYESIEEIKKHFIDERVTKLMWGGFGDWMQWLSTQLGMNYIDFSLDPARSSEVFQRRNVIVHNGGLVSSQYMDKVPQSVGVLSLGDPLPVTTGYLASALDELGILGVLTTYLVMTKLCETELQHEDVDRDIRRVVGDLVNARRLAEADKVASIALSNTKHKAERLRLRVYRWIALKGLSGKAAIETEVEELDTTEWGEDLELMKLFLLDDSRATEFAINLADKGGSAADRVATWPSLAEFWRKITDQSLKWARSR